MTKPTDPDRKRPSRIEQAALIERELGNMNKRREWLADHYIGPANTPTIDDPTDQQIYGLAAIMAIEEEWILDEQLREELSIITYED